MSVLQCVLLFVAVLGAVCVAVCVAGSDIAHQSFIFVSVSRCVL